MSKMGFKIIVFLKNELHLFAAYGKILTVPWFDPLKIGRREEVAIISLPRHILMLPFILPGGMGGGRLVRHLACWYTELSNVRWGSLLHWWLAPLQRMFNLRSLLPEFRVHVKIVVPRKYCVLVRVRLQLANITKKKFVGWSYYFGSIPSVEAISVTRIR